MLRARHVLVLTLVFAFYRLADCVASTVSLLYCKTYSVGVIMECCV